jgi:hypothetical protein
MERVYHKTVEKLNKRITAYLLESTCDRRNIFLWLAFFNWSISHRQNEEKHVQRNVCSIDCAIFFKLIMLFLLFIMFLIYHFYYFSVDYFFW